VSLQIVVGGRNKYMINGHVKQPAQVQTLFHSVQLNINNPHFLIMQGRITKVLNMKPPEILSMLEEAAGTKMYESKKEVALKTLEKKQTKVDEIDNLLSQDILPALEKLRKERAQYQQWTSGNAQVDRLERFCIAFEFSEADRFREAASGEVKDMQEKVDSFQAAAKGLEEEIAEKDVAVAALTEAKEKQMNSEMKSLSDRVDKLSTALVKVDSAFNAKQDSFTTEKAAAEQVRYSLLHSKP
jgi:structural maintenance of chromosome 2